MIQIPQFQEESYHGNDHSADSIQSKIDDLVRRFKQTHDWSVYETEGEEIFKEIVQGKFRYYDDLEPIFSQRPSIPPIFTTENADKDNYDLDLNDSQVTFDDEFSESVSCYKYKKRYANLVKKSYSNAKKKSN